MHKRRMFFAALAAGALTVQLAAAPAASAATVSDPIADGLAGPLQFAVSKHGTVYVGQSFAGTLTRFRDGERRDLVSRPGAEIAGVAVSSHHSLVFTAGGGEAGPPSSTLNRYYKGHTRKIADLLKYETRRNPDARYRYGFVGLSPECKAQIPEDFGPPSYRGGVDSHAYAVAEAYGKHYVADAGGNTILKVDDWGRVRTLAVLPPQPATISAEVAAGFGLPECVAGHDYLFESVPTDVELGPNGWLYVTTLPGGPEDPSLGARGSVYKINPFTGHYRRIATGFLGATNLAVTPRGNIYVTEMFGGQVSKVAHGGPVPIVSLPSPAAIEYANHKLYVSYDAFENGTVATIRF